MVAVGVASALIKGASFGVKSSKKKLLNSKLKWRHSIDNIC